ncbi:EthD family reductase [Pseudonocardia humida]|uniref:EthD family reductase n=1 Tax=Pseudonocardia humida TaxID=2800819 RepID=A0ABT1AB54_9PSEU|nr:EthD family reductase [Pseudonocardia humida]MCO1660262.1 EthD family reductase [Pseudonocardia humida]
MYQLTVLYHHPDDAAAFDKHYNEVHIPLASKMPGLRRYSVSHPAPGPDGSKPAYHLIAVLEWDDEAAFGAAVTSPEGAAATGDVANFATNGATMLSGSATLAT